MRFYFRWIFGQLNKQIQCALYFVLMTLFSFMFWFVCVLLALFTFCWQIRVSSVHSAFTLLYYSLYYSPVLKKCNDKILLSITTFCTRSESLILLQFFTLKSEITHHTYSAFKQSISWQQIHIEIIDLLLNLILTSNRKWIHFCITSNIDEQHVF